MPGCPGGSLCAWESRCPRGAIRPSQAWGSRSSFTPWEPRWSHGPWWAGGPRLPLPPREPWRAFMAWVTWGARGARGARQPWGAGGSWLPGGAGCSQLSGWRERGESGVGEWHRHVPLSTSAALCPCPACPCRSSWGWTPQYLQCCPPIPPSPPHPSITHLCLPHQMPSPHLSPLSLIPWGVLQVRVDSWLPQHPVILVAPEVLVVRGGPEAPGDPAAPGCPSSLSPQTAPAGPAPRGTRGHLSLPVGMRSEPGSCPMQDSGTAPAMHTPKQESKSRAEKGEKSPGVSPHRSSGPPAPPPTLYLGARRAGTCRADAVGAVVHLKGSEL